MTDGVQTGFRIRMALLFLGLPLAGGLAAVALGSSVTRALPVDPDGLELAVVAMGVVWTGVMIAVWMLDGRALRRREHQCLVRDKELALRRQELDATEAQQALQLKLTMEAQDRENAIREERVKIREFEHAIRQSERSLEQLEGAQAADETTVVNAPE